MEEKVLLLVIILHILLLAVAGLVNWKKKAGMTWGTFVFCFLIPLFGSVCALELVLEKAPDPELLKDRIRSQDPIRKSYIAPELEAASTAPMEETFLLNEPKVRREMMMKLLHENPAENVELLLMARFNDDPETAHYATATLTEGQRKMELGLQQSQRVLAKQPDNQEERLYFISQMETYIASGILEGHLLDRQRKLLEREFVKLPETDTTLELGCLRCRNLLSLKKAPEAADEARRLLKRFPGAEEPYLELMRICAESQDAAGARRLAEEMAGAGILWSYKGREKMEYFLKGLA